MSLVNWRRRQDRIDEVIVPESAFGEGEPLSSPPNYVSSFVNHALYTAMYLREELPREAVIAATLGDYLAGVRNDGHHLWVGNTVWCIEHRSTSGRDWRSWSSARRGASSPTWRRLRCSSRNASRAAIGCTSRNSTAGSPAGSGRRPTLHSAWIQTRPWIRTIPDEEYFRTRAWETPNHRLREERLEERKLARAGAMRQGLLALRAGLRSHKATGWRRWLWRLMAKWHSWRAND